MSNITVDEASFAHQNTCTALQEEGQVAIAKNLLNVRKLPLQADRWKNWDQYLAVYHASRLTDKDEAILDAGACRDKNYPSTFLPAMHKRKYTDLHGCNLDEGKPVIDAGALYQHGDITASPYTDAQFSFVSCLSTIEHGVDWRKFYLEMARIIKPRGHLFVSFDYWIDPVDTKGQMAFGVPIHIFNKQEVMAMAVFAYQNGLRLMKVPDFECKEPLVKWMGMEYTFFNLLFRR